MASSAMGKEKSFLTQGTQAAETLVFDYSSHFNSELQVLETGCEQMEEMGGGVLEGDQKRLPGLANPACHTH